MISLAGFTTYVTFCVSTLVSPVQGAEVPPTHGMPLAGVASWETPSGVTMKILPASNAHTNGSLGLLSVAWYRIVSQGLTVSVEATSVTPSARNVVNTIVTPGLVQVLGSRWAHAVSAPAQNRIHTTPVHQCLAVLVMIIPLLLGCVYPSSRAAVKCVRRAGRSVPVSCA